MSPDQKVNISFDEEYIQEILLNSTLYGWRRQEPDERDRPLDLPRSNAWPRVLSLRKLCPPVHFHARMGSCTEQALAFAYQFDRLKKKKAGEQREEDSKEIETDPSILIPSSLSSPNTEHEASSNFRTSLRAMKLEDSKRLHLEYKILEQNWDAMKSCLQSHRPFVFGFDVFESFEGKQVSDTGVVSVPKEGEKMLGGYAVVAVGYDENKGMIEVCDLWGEKGYFFMPKAYVLNPDLASDFWVVETVDRNMEEDGDGDGDQDESDHITTQDKEDHVLITRS